jgi:hypothetical protein
MAKAKSRAAQIRNYLEKNPYVKAIDVAKHLGVPAHAVYNVRWAMKKEVPLEVVDPVEVSTEEVSTEEVSAQVSGTTRVNTAQIDMVDWFVNKFGLDYNLGNAVKYIAFSDIAMAKRYLERAA